MREPIFPDMDGIEQCVDTYLEQDVVDATMAANGMPRSIFLNYHIINFFLRANPQVNSVLDITPEVLAHAAALCSDHFGIPREELISSYERVTAKEWYDHKLREELELKKAKTFAP